MDSSVKTRPNHYETLGLAPGASKDEIARAYARGIGAFGSRSLSDVAAASIAFETLRDPDRRRAYDSSLGLGRMAPPRVVYTAGRAQFTGPAPAAFAGEALHATLLPFASVPKQTPAEPRTASFIAASLRPPVDHAPEPEPVRLQPQPEQIQAQAPPMLDRPVHRTADLRLADADDGAVQWSRTGVIVGSLIAGVVLVGAFAGWQAGHGDEQPPVEAGVTAALPAPKPVAAATLPAPAPVTSALKVQPRRVVRAPVAAASAELPAAPRESTRIEQLAEAIQSEPAPPEVLASEEPSSDFVSAEVAAAMPLPNATIARTIERIGYSCGKVASTSAIEGAQGVFKVTCTSGQSYRAAPVRGRYHFRRMAGR